MELNRKDIPYPLAGQLGKIKNQQTRDASKYPQGYFKDKPCRRCLTSFSPFAPSEHYCCDTCKEEALADAYIYREYKISLDNYRDLFIAQGGTCKICKKVGFKIDVDTSVDLVIDHDHETGHVRGLLCHNCNRALGLLKDSPVLLQEALNYLIAPKIEFEETPANRLFRTRQRKIELSSEMVCAILIDWFQHEMRTMELAKKYSVSKATIKNITSRRGKYTEGYKLYEESATTIPKGSTSQANGDGSGLPQTDNAEGDDIVCSA